ncbi:MAG: EAL domain-containing protein [Lachnospiraceae bacterium]|nr:EAL domain-containing protein [Lachnospiraceae bacterium]
MVQSKGENNRFLEKFTGLMAGGAFVCRQSEGYEILFANDNLIELFECDDYDDFMSFVGGSFSGMVNASQLKSIMKEVDIQIRVHEKTNGRLFYHVRTKKDNIRLVEEYWNLVEDEVEGPLYYSFLVSRESEAMGTDFDPITGLYGKARFHSYVTSMNQSLTGKDDTEYAITYVNFVNFKLLNINKGVAEGDACLKTIADILTQVFDDAFISRLSDDHFAIFSKHEGIFAKLHEAGQLFAEAYGNRYHIIGKNGIYKFVPNAEFDVEAALSFAKVACDFIKYDAKRDIVNYSEELAQNMKISEYVIHRIDEAIEKEWIRIFYQPVVRSLTRQLCGMESLVRWSDMEMGFLMPGQIVGILEENRQIHKLDCYVVEKVCQCIHDRVQKGLPMVPVSVNFSRQDFINCDMLSVVERCVEKYDVPRDYIHIEITESMIVSDEELMRGVIESFRKMGYEIWMDDFGSGYSSLTLLKDYQFDMLKLDMRFLTPFTEKSKDIIRSTIIMAKDLGIQTLAEGVETKEQLDFLREVGCGKIQGYYYGRPEPIEDLFANLWERQISIETRKWRHYYEVASFHVKATDVPLEVIEYDGHTFRTLFMNKPYRDQIGISEHLSLGEIDHLIYHNTTPLTLKYIEFAEQIKESGKQETFYYTYGHNYLCFKGQVMVQNDDRCIIKGSIYNMATNREENIREKMDSKLRVLNLLFKVILYADLKTETLTPLLGTTPNMKPRQSLLGDVKENNALFAAQNIHPTERARYREFMNFENMKEKMAQSPFGYLTDIFHIKQPDGKYRIAEVTLLMLPGTDGQEFLYCVKPYFTAKGYEREGVNSLLFKEDELDRFRVLWDNMLWNSDLKFFWKDDERKFRGASQAFLDYFGLKSVDDIDGKTDEDMHWHVNDAPYKNDEEAVLQRGERVVNVPGQCIAKGMIHNIVCTKIPIYRDGRIVGLVGHFFDCDDELISVRKNFQNVGKDAVTGLMDAHSFVNTLVDYSVQYLEKHRVYGVIAINNAKHHRIIETYGDKIANEAIKCMGKIIVDIFGPYTVVARTRGAVFGILFYADEDLEIPKKLEEIKEKLEGINSVDGNAITMRIRTSVKVRTDEGITDENIYTKALIEVLDE